MTQDSTVFNSIVPKSIEKTIITPPSGFHVLDVVEMWHYRDLLRQLVWRNITVRYKQTIFGALWVVLQPFITMVVFTIIFGNFAKIPSDGIPYPIFSFSALVVWTFFSSGLTSVATSITGNISMLKKIYFPRLLYPLSTLFSSLVDFVPSFTILLIMVLVYQIFGTSLGVDPGTITLSLRVLWFIPLIILAFFTALGFGLWLAVLNVQFRDVRYATGFLIRIWMYITPIIYPASLVDENLRYLYYMNPMVTVIEGFRWAVLGKETTFGVEVFISIIICGVILTSGLVFFDRNEKWFADVA